MKNLPTNLSDMRFASLVALVARTWRKTIDQRLQQYNLTEATWLPLFYLSQIDKPIRQKDLASMLSLDSTSVVRILNNLEKLGFIERTEEERDHRAKATKITSHGREVIEQLIGISTALENEIKATIDPEEFKITRHVLESLYLTLNHLQAIDDQV